VNVRLATWTAWLLAGLLTMPAAAGAAAKLTPHELSVKRSLGENREPRTIRLQFQASETVANVPSVVVSDTRGPGGEAFTGTVTATAQLISNQTVTVDVMVDPMPRDLGDFTTDVSVRGGDVEAADVPLTVTLTRNPTRTGAWVLAIVALVLGILAGLALRWVSGTGSKLRDLLGRHEVVLGSLRGLRHRPTGLERDLGTVRRLLAQGDVTRAEAAIQTLEQRIAATLPALDALDVAAARVDEHERGVAGLPGLDAAGRRALLDVVAVERRALADAVREAYPDPEPGKATRLARVQGIAQFSAFLDSYADPAQRDGDMAAALDLYRTDQFTAAYAKWSAVGPAAAAASKRAPALDDKEAEMPLPAAGRTSGLLWWAARHAPTLFGLLGAVALVILGLQTVFDVDTMFMTDDVENFLTLIAWGLGSALVGLTTTELASKLAPAR
jgi:hypothetical protein